MLSKRYSIAELLLVLGIALLVFMAGNARPWATPVHAETEAAPAAAVPGGPGYVMIPSNAFIPAQSTTVYRSLFHDLAVPSGSPTAFFYAPVSLPQGARLTGMTMFYIDDTNDLNTIGVDMLRKALPSSNLDPSFNPAALVGLSVESMSSSFYRSDTTPDPNRAVVDNSQYKYFLFLSIDPTPTSTYLLFQGVRIDYTFNLALPLISQ